MTQIVGEIGGLLDQLSTMYCGYPAVTGPLPVSAPIDLEPILLCWVNDKLNLPTHEIAVFSP
ncbi:hypothetical protein [Burkholderia sola]|uniref:hypothetical protein n=1 Tax=Burkholderia sola TaxID=2843302 RepID=UPI00338F4986